jgi:predicted GNAT family acetyltransferase
MSRPTEGVPDSRAEPLSDIGELGMLYRHCNMDFWASEMIQFGHYRGVRDPSSGVLVSAAGVNFILVEVSYAQVGSVATMTNWRRKGYASACVCATLSSLNKAGIRSCGLFVDSTDSTLYDFYRRLEFTENGRYRFLPFVGGRGDISQFDSKIGANDEITS